MRKYETYKDSGYSIVGTIPKHWNCAPLKRFLKEKLAYGANETAEESNTNHPRYIRITDISEKGTLNEDFKSLPPEKAKSYLLNQGDLLFARCGATVGKAYMFNESYPACYAGYLIKAVLGKSVSPKFVLYYTQSSSYLEWKDAIFIRSTIQNIGADKYSLLPLPIPPRSEQQHIVAFLDEKIAKIDEYIAKKEAEIESLKEWKKAFIAHVVTKGLNPQAKMKGSGVSWIGEVPEHWKKVRFGSIFKLKSFKNHTDDDEMLSVFLDRGVIFASDSEKRTHNPSEDLSKYQLVEPSDFVMNNQQAWRGSVGVSSFRGIISPAYHIFTMPKSLLPRFANYLLRDRGMVGQFETSSRGVGSIQRTLNFNWLNNSTVCIPPLDEQKEIVDYIDAATTKADKMIVELSYHVEHMKEYKQCLISDVVTGKINVQPT